MARIPGLIWRPLPENAYQPAIRPTQWILHTAVDAPGPTNLGDYFERKDVELESHTWLRWDRHEQFIDTEVRADANYLANRRAVSTETEDDGTPAERPWNEYQLRELIRTGVELHRLHGIPPVLPPTWDAPGMGYHSLYPGYWTNVKGKTCPGSTRINQFKTIVLPGIQAALQHGDPLMALTDAEQAELLSRVRAMHVGNWVASNGEGDLRWLETIVRRVVTEALDARPPGSGTVDPAAIAEELARRLAA